MKIFYTIAGIILVGILIILFIPVNKLPAYARQILYRISGSCRYYQPNDPDPYGTCDQPDFTNYIQ
jgi:hypothetical protein